MISRFQLGLIAIAVIFAFRFFSVRPIHHPPGIIAADEPLQVNYEKVPQAVKIKDVVMDPLATYHIRARVISTERYWSDHGSDLSPIDFCVGWGRLSDSTILDQLSFSQTARFCNYSWSQKPPVPELEIVSHVANMHLIPADKTITHLLKKVRIGQLVTLDGELVRALYEDGGVWTSSLTRSDTGNGACELMLVKSVQIENN